MSYRTRSALIVASAIAASYPLGARAVPVDFPAGSWIIPMDACYQPSAPQKCTSSSPTATCTNAVFTGGSWPTVYQTASDGRLLSNYYANGTCPEPLTQTPAHDGITKAYGLIYRLLQHGVPVYYVVQTNTASASPPYKTAINSTDMTVSTVALVNPVALLNHTPGSSTFGTPVSFMTLGHNSIDYRGAPFVISAADIVTYNVINLLKTDPLMSATDPRTGRGVFQDVYIHVAQTNILQASVKALLNTVPPRLALMGVGGAGLSNLVGYLLDAGLYTSTAVASYPTIGDVFTEFLNSSDITGGGLISGGFKLLWAPHWDSSALSQSVADSILSAIGAFNAQGGTVMLQCASIDSAEGTTGTFGTGSGSQYGHFLTTASGTNPGLNVNSLPYFADTGIHPVYPTGVSGESFAANPTASATLWSDPLVQVGDFNLTYSNRQSAVLDFVPNSASYKTSVDRLISSTAPSNESSYQNRDIFARLPAAGGAGQIIYIGGHSFSTVFSGCNAWTCAAMTTSSCAQFATGGTCAPNNGNCCEYGSPGTMPGLERLVLNSIIFLGQVPTTTERTRSSPVVYLDGKTYLGSYVQQTQPAAAYPPWSGHFREYPAGALAGTNVTAFNSVPVIDWDSATHIATQAAADSRTIFTAIPVSGKMTQTSFTTANATALGISAATITAIRKGGLGGIDHSIPAIIGPSGVTGSASRPEVAYVGALDGMVHCIFISGTATGHTPGDELWAYIPNSQLSKVASQSGGVDGSPSVGDAFIINTSGIRSWRTVLAIPDDGYAGGTMDAIDVTDPLNPSFLWEASDSTTIATKTYVMGRAQGAAIAPILGNQGVEYAYFFATDNTNGTAGNGFNVYAVDAGTGSVIWRYNHLYANDTTHNDVPGTVSAVDSTGQNGTADTVFFGDIEGKVWSLPAPAGPTTTPSPIYDAAVANGLPTSVNYPIESALSLYRDPATQHLDLLGITGGADWVPTSTLSYVFSYDTTTRATTTLATLGVGERAYAAPTISGNSVYLLTSAGAIQGATGSTFSAAGYIVRIGLGGSQALTRLATVTQGASEVWVDSSSNVTAASATGITQNGNSGVDTSQSVSTLSNNSRPFTIQAWLDLH